MVFLQAIFSTYFNKFPKVAYRNNLYETYVDFIPNFSLIVKQLIYNLYK